MLNTVRLINDKYVIHCNNLIVEDPLNVLLSVFSLPLTVTETLVLVAPPMVLFAIHV